ncbi:hypothetical protein DFH09DRAFT_1087047 [Mycena vulgaris]|nr:hypothetical protein DFH09DRAFT_1087047 [Mycena vulgaris]
MATKACGLYTRPGRGGAIRGVRVRADEGVRGLRKTTLALRIRGRGDGIRVVYFHSGKGEGLRGGGREETYLSLSRRGTGGKAAPMDSSSWVSRRLQPEGARWAGEGVSAAAMRVDKIYNGSGVVECGVGPAKRVRHSSEEARGTQEGQRNYDRISELGGDYLEREARSRGTRQPSGIEPSYRVRLQASVANLRGINRQRPIQSMFGEWKWIPDGRSTSTAWGALNYVWSAPFDHNVCNLERVKVGIRSRSKRICVWGRGLEITSGWGLTRAHTIGVGLRTMNSTIKGMKWITTRSTGTRPTVQYIVLNSEAKRTGKPIQRLQSFRSARFGINALQMARLGVFKVRRLLFAGVSKGGMLNNVVNLKKDRPLDKYPNAFWDILRSQMCPHCFAKARDDHSASLRSFWRRIPTTFRLPPWPELYAMERDVMGEARSKPAAEDANVVIFALGLRNMGIKPELGLGSWYSGINMIIRSQGRHLYMMQQRRLIWTRSRSMAVLDQDAGAVGGPVYPRTDALARAEIIFVFKSSRRTKLGNHLRGSASVVLRSESPDIRVGKYVYDFAVSHQEYSVITVVHDQQIIEKHPGLPWTAHLGAAGMPGTQVKWHGWLGRSIHMLNFVRSGKLRGKLNTVQKEIGFVTTGAVYAASRDVPHARVWTTAIEPKFVQMGNEATIIRRETSFCGNSERN